jgi:hypothetical protein
MWVLALARGIAPSSTIHLTTKMALSRSQRIAIRTAVA